MPKTPLSVTIITLNEERNIARAIQSVTSWVDEVLVVDSGSTDRTREIAQGLGATVLTQPWTGYGQQKNFAQKQARHDWILSLDADEEVPRDLADEIRTALEGSALRQTHGFSMPRRTLFLGRWVRHGGWYPNYLTRLADRRHAAWTEPPVHEELKIEGEVHALEHPLIHHAFPDIAEQVTTNLRYSRLGCERLSQDGVRGSTRLLVLKPVGKFFETYVLKRGFLDGIRGFMISVNASYSMFLKYAFLLEKELPSNEDSDHR